MRHDSRHHALPERRRRFRPRRLGARDGAGAQGRRRRGARLGRRSDRGRGGAREGHRDGGPARGRRGRDLRLSSCRPACRSPIPSRIGPRCSRSQAGVEIIGDIELFCRERRGDRAGRAVRRRSPAPTASRPRRRSSRTCCARPGATCRWAAISARRSCRSSRRRRPRPRHRVLVVPDRSRALAQRRRSACSSTSRRTISTGTGRWRTTRRSRSGSSPGPGSPSSASTTAVSAAIAERLAASGRSVIRVSARHSIDGRLRAADGATMLRADKAVIQARCADLAGIGSLRGAHNAQNAAAALAAASRARLAAPDLQRPSHLSRASPIAWKRSAGGEALFVNDSKATNADSTEKALASFRRHPLDPRRQGEGGRHRGAGSLFRAYREGVSDRRGDGEFRRTLEGTVPFARCGTLDKAVAMAAQDADASKAAEPVVLLSPACASYDQYPNFEMRGDHFRDLVRALPGIEPTRGGLEHGVARGTVALRRVVVDRRPHDARGARRADGRRPRFPDGGPVPRSPSGSGLPTFHFVNRQVLFLCPRRR